jgi:hypothetical protein
MQHTKWEADSPAVFTFRIWVCEESAGVARGLKGSLPSFFCFFGVSNTTAYLLPDGNKSFSISFPVRPGDVRSKALLGELDI